MEHGHLDSDVAASFGLTLCDFCHQPREIHTGFDHGQRKCLLARDGISMVIAFPKQDERHDAIRRVNAYYERLEAIDNCGSGI